MEIAERKGTGHPDTICDCLAENLSRSLCRHYMEHFGTVLHHNVDKALLCGGQAEASFGRGRVIEPIDIYLSGRATTDVHGHIVPIETIASEVSRAWFSENLHALDASSHVRVHCLVRQGSSELVDLFRRRSTAQIARANDTSIGVGYAPLSTLETIVLRIERDLNRRIRSGEAAAWGEDIKVMGARTPNGVQLTVACALIAGHITDLDAYEAEKHALKQAAFEVARQHTDDEIQVAVNAADAPLEGSVYLTVTGTSAEAGDDGQVGRGNRANGLITPHRPMSLEALAGKNPVSHVGKLYNAAAQDIAETLVDELSEVARSECYLLSQIGAPVTEPAVVDIRLRTQDGQPASAISEGVEGIARDKIARIPDMIQDFIDGRINIV